MMDSGPESKRPRLTGPGPGQWPPTEASRQLPPVPAGAPYHTTPFSRPPEPPHHLDRRSSGHAEHPPYEHQDPRRPGSGPSHGYHHHPSTFPAQRGEAMVKRDPSDEPPHYRPPSTGAITESNPNAPPGHEPARYLPPFEPQPAYPRSSFPPPPSPMTASEPYGAIHYANSTAGPRDVFPSVSYPSASSSQNAQGKQIRKATRAAQACDSCRALKAKCDEGRPGCGTCREKGTECRYRDPPPKQQDKTSADILDTLMRIESSMQGIQGDMKNMKKVQDILMQALPASAEARLKQETQESLPNSIGEFIRPSVGSESQALPSTESPYSTTPGHMRIPERQDPLQHGEEEEEEEEGGDPGPLKAPSIPVNHTTGAARLLLVGPIAEMCHDIMKNAKIKNEKYPIIQEEKRGLLRLYGRGEGTDAPPGYDRDPLIDHGSESTSGDTNSDVSSPAGEEWGQLGGLTPPGNPPPEFTRGSINIEGMPDLSREKVLELVKSYKKHINNMHPILIPSRLDVLVETFLKSTPESQAKSKHISSVVSAGYPQHTSVSAGFVGNPQSPGNKRKRSPALAEYPEVPNHHDVKPGHPFRSISSALVLLVLALGQISLHKGKIPECVPDRDHDGSWANSPIIRNGHPPSPLQSSPSMSTPMGIPSPQETDRMQPRSRRTSIEAAYAPKSVNTRPKNLDVIPGLFYFALATDIIGNQLGGNSLQHVHVNVLAGLYHGQLARVMESHAYIHQACRSLQVILRPKLDRFKKIKADGLIVPAKDNPLVIAFWTCLQLESDIVAELPCPHSGILTYEDDMPSPNFQAASDIDGFEATVMESYGAQLFLRKHLNQLHNMFYRPENDSQFPSVYAGKEPRHFPTIEACQENLNSVSTFAPHMAWNENDPPADNILEARLRAKYYGAQVITYRHFVLKILEHSATQKSIPGEQISTEFKTGIEVPSINRNATRKEEIDPKVLQYAKFCIKALIKSTTAFHGLGDPGRDRIIVTNIWGTAHAQWGNILTLQAAFKDPILHELIDERELRDLLEKTIAFLKLVSHNSSALHIDLRILQHTGQLNNLLPTHSQAVNESSSFSSTSGETGRH
ncbi:hypothetical protein G7Y89_g8977 [Cudoniella acicularis]|uniref:Zn(2)-C6 fungal-type domain-containing protein n=1 Tax=Cudoniella acicularis TaxID=354080 RepID=A0A8H4W0I8_9HELO|nr:hypothetical protein G7Y89_g8977 [Cudoniella acicularis]